MLCNLKENLFMSSAIASIAYLSHYLH